jgi:K+-sensing histidine kinase KdpD
VKLLALLHTVPARYFAAIVLVAGGVVLTALLPDEIQRRNSTLFFGAVMVSAWWGGFGPGLVATVLSALSITWFFTPSVRAFELSHDDRIRVSLFLAMAALISYLNGARQRAEERHAELLLREKIGRARSESMEWRYAALADAAGIVARVRDPESALGRITHLAVPRFASASAVLARNDAGMLTTRAATRPAGTAPDGDEMAAASLVLEKGHAEVTARLIVVPLATGGRVLGVMSFVAGAERTYREEDLAFAQDLGHHAALLLARA